MTGRSNDEKNIYFDDQEEAVQSPHPLRHDYPGKEYDFHNWVGLTDAAREGCHHCYVLLHTLDEEHVLRFTNPDNLGSEESTSPLKLRIRSWDRSWTGTPGVMVSWEMHSVKQQLSDITLEPLEEGIDLSEAESRFIDHPSCHARIRDDSRDRKPTRLLFVGDRVNLSVNLCETKTLDSSRTNYMTLSHCWGDGVPLRLLHENYIKFLAGIEFSEIHKTFRDAIDATRRLNVQYLWTDSLCIIQDSREDWLHESAKMHHIYQNSYLNLMAAASSNSHCGLYSAKYPFSSIPFLVPLGDPHNPKLASYPYMNARRENLNNLTLFSRGWVMQERVLARRNLIFGKEIHWECHDSSGSENCPVGSALENSGTASNITPHYGLWSLHLRSSLLWHCIKTSIPAKDFIAPSWSWASVGTFVQWFDADDFDGLAEVFQVDVTLASQGHSFGPVAKGTIRLNGPMCHARLVRTKYTEILCFGQDTKDMVSNPNVPEDDGDNVVSGFRTVVLLDHLPWSEQEMTSDTEVGVTVYVAPLQTDIDLKLTYSGLLRLGGLLLVPTGLSPGQFRSIGHFFIQDQWGMESRRVYEERIEWLNEDTFGNGVVTKTLRSLYTSVVNLGYAGEIGRFLDYIDRCADERRKLGVTDPNLGEKDVEASGWYRYEIV
ncbi:heterokaryon incompatibility protein-domain-containing protein [Pseudoneurospora amorphoporcata]|uniref:Heterokaryon incompatibility protein-domain-containing protein n=1 Tax=Pseudoneurospora amorphoporcata TaxID=241081 RepID=A0AAN6NTV7_9PEZI|nr:heterokaryon incompatibility protein-domain-containing protein [Pseudoneurospora amorphoporcata]